MASLIRPVGPGGDTRVAARFVVPVVVSEPVTDLVDVQGPGRSVAAASRFSG